MSGKTICLPRDAVDREPVERDLVDAREEILRPRRAGDAVLGHQRRKEALLDRGIVDHRHAAEGHDAGVGHRRIAFEAAVVEDLARLVDGKARASLVLDVGAQMPSRPGAVHVDASIHPDIEQRRAVGRAVDADGRQPAAETALQQRFDARLVHRQVAAAYFVWCTHERDCRRCMVLSKGPFSSDGADHFRHGDRPPGGRAAVPAGLCRHQLLDRRRQIAGRRQAAGKPRAGRAARPVAHGGRGGLRTIAGRRLRRRPHRLGHLRGVGPARPAWRTRARSARPAAPRATARRGLPARSTSPCRATTARSISAAR